MRLKVRGSMGHCLHAVSLAIVTDDTVDFVATHGIHRCTGCFTETECQASAHIDVGRRSDIFIEFLEDRQEHCAPETVGDSGVGIGIRCRRFADLPLAVALAHFFHLC